MNKNNLVYVTRNNTPPLDIALINARSIGNKTTSIHDYIVENETDIIVITETWHLDIQWCTLHDRVKEVEVLA